MSDGGEDQAAEEEAFMGQKKAKSHHCQFLERAVSGKAALPFQRLEPRNFQAGGGPAVDRALVVTHLGAVRHQPQPSHTRALTLTPTSALALH